MAPHRALCTYDVLQVIFAHLSPRDSLEDIQCKRQALARSSRVCRFFKDPALDVLWEVLGSPLPLFMHFSTCKPINEVPEHTLARLKHCADDTHLNNGPIVAHEWWIFQSYARRVREISYGGGLSSVIAGLALYNKYQPLLPSLLKISWYQSSININLLYLLPPSLLIVHIVLVTEPKDTDEVARSLVRRLVAKAPSLQDLQVSGWMSSKGLQPIAKFRSLRALILTGDNLANIDILRSLSTLPTLTILSLSFAQQELTSTPCFTFSNLQVLRLSCSSRDVVPITLSISAPHLYSFVLYSCGEYDYADHVELINVVCASYGASLRSIDVDIDVCSFSDEPQNLSSLYIFRPLLSLRYLERVILAFETYKRLSFSDQDVHDVASTWPNLTEFSLRHRSSKNIPSLDAILAFVRLCPKLTSLTFPAINASVVPEPQLPPVVSRTLRRVYTSKCVVNRRMDVAKYLHSAFPQLDPPSRIEARLREVPWNGVMVEIAALQAQAMKLPMEV